MNINTGFNPYSSNMVNSTDLTKMSQSQSLTGAPNDVLKEGEIFEGSINSIDNNGKVTIGLANGQTMTARLDAGVSLTPGQSVFFEVKSNDGNLIQIRTVSLGELNANPTLLKALDFANIAASERTINMVNTMMQNQVSISPENLVAMNRAMINNPEVDPQTLVSMSKYGMELSPDNVAMFQNYVNDKALLNDNFQILSDMLPEAMAASDVTVEQAININNQIKEIFLDMPNQESVINSQEGQIQENVSETQQVPQNSDVVQNNTSNINNVIQNNLKPEDILLNNIAQKGEQFTPESTESVPQTIIDTTQASQNPAQNIAVVEQNELGNQILNSFAGESQVNSFNTLLSTLPDFPKDNMEIFSEDGTLKADASIKEVFREITEYLNEHPDIPKATLNDIIKSPLYKGLLKNIIADSFAMEPKDVTKPGEISKLYERVLKQTEALEKIMSGVANKAAETIKNQTSEIKQNINFMNSANEMYNFVQIPLKMYNQNTDSMLYVRQNKKSSYEAGEEITAFLHFDMEYLGPTDVYITLKETNVGCKWNLADEESMDLIEKNLDILTERLEAKGFSVKSEVTCKEPKIDFASDFLGLPPVEAETKTEGMVHRYSFDMRA